ncbi:MAG: hypothetical protein ACFFAS_08915 [Promethearchaeota archaeon]
MSKEREERFDWGAQVINDLRKKSVEQFTRERKIQANKTATDKDEI